MLVLCFFCGLRYTLWHMATMTLSQELQWRGFINQTSLTDVAALDNKKWAFYNGYDASADSLTIGNLAAVMLDKCFIRHGSKALLLAGGATSLIGDPGGKDSERLLQTEEEVEKNVSAVKIQLEQLFGEQVHLVNNLSWFKDRGVLDFLRDVGKYFSMTPLVQRDYIASRMNESGGGISYTEFSYTLLQGYDFLHLHRTYGVDLQLAGSDQWGNALSGVELVRKVTGDEVHALTMPLIIDKSTGKKFGKSEAGAIWLDANKTTVYQFYQFWLNVDDDSVGDYLKIFTELSKEQIGGTMTSFERDKSGRLAQKTLAYEVTKLVHGEEKVDAVKHATEVLFGESDFFDLTKGEVELLMKELPTVKAEDNLAHTVVKAGLASSNTEAANFIDSGAIYINGQKATLGTKVGFQKGNNLLRRGKNSFAIIENR